MITSTSGSQVKGVIALRKKARERNARSLFVVEGPKMLFEAPPERVEKVYVSESFLKRYGNELSLRALPVETVSDSVLSAMSDTQTPQGAICLVKQYQYTAEDLLGGGQRAPLCMILENLQDPGNLGTIVRTAEGAGVTGILMSRDCVDIYNPKVIRSTMGSVYRMPFCYADDLHAVIREWKKKGVRVYAAHLKGELYHTGIDCCGPSAFLIGNEGNGLREDTAELADCLIRIPMEGKVESLNAAVASAVLMYEALRQRMARRSGD